VTQLHQSRKQLCVYVYLVLVIMLLLSLLVITGVDMIVVAVIVLIVIVITSVVSPTYCILGRALSQCQTRSVFFSFWLLISMSVYYFINQFITIMITMIIIIIIIGLYQ